MGLLDYIFAALVMGSAICVPYTKVEESFFMQAVHDILKWGKRTSSYDHLAYPGVVPRSFVGPLVISALALPIKMVGRMEDEGMGAHLLARLVLGGMVALANGQLRGEIGRLFGQRTSAWFGVFCICQFHYVFWTSRLLSNTIALVPMLMAQKYWLRSIFSTSSRVRQHSYQCMAAILVFTCVVLRFDVVVFAAVMLISSVTAITRRAVGLALSMAVVSAALTLLVDSYYWQARWMWPELQVFLFNVVQGRSTEWGAAPPYHYFVNFLPRLLLGALPFALVGGLADPRASRLAAAYVAAIGIFSVNEHKEWRFIMPAIPIFNLCAGMGVSLLEQASRTRRLATAAAAALSGLGLLVVLLMTYISSLNYPGGHALALLHTLEHGANVNVHIDTYTAMTGVTRFGQIRSDWVYDKSEHLEPGQFGNFTHLLTSQPQRHLKSEFEVAGMQRGFSMVEVAPIRSIPAALLAGRLPWSIQQEPLVWIMRRVDTPSQQSPGSY